VLADSPTPDSARDFIRRIVGWCADVCEANPHAVSHDGPCGVRFKCPRHGEDAYHRAELLRNGDLLLHCEGKSLRRSDLGYAECLAELEPQDQNAEERRRQELAILVRPEPLP
jgi:hypothetical protein